MNVRGLLQRFHYDRGNTVVVADKEKKTELSKLEILCPAMLKGNIGDEEVSSFTVKDGILKIYTRRTNG